MNKIDAAVMPYVIPQAMGCPEFVILQTLQNVAADFCSDSGIWQDTLQEIIYKDTQEFFLSLNSNQRLARVFNLFIRNQRLPVSKDSYYVSSDSIVLKSKVLEDTPALIHVALKPSKLSNLMPCYILEDWADEIANGVLAKIKLMSGQGVTWSDTQGAVIHQQRYDEGIAKARIKQERNKKQQVIFNQWSVGL